jgi:PBP1b-binding outer membrane lipoprotein LpoB
MKKMKTTIYIAVLSLLITSCSTSYEASTVPVQEFTTTEDIYSLNKGMSVSDVISKLGVDPYDITYNLTNNTKTLVWNYKSPHREIKKKKNDKSSLTSGSERYVKDFKELYVSFSNDRLIRFYTSEGQERSEELFIIQHTLEYNN